MISSERGSVELPNFKITEETD